MSTATVALPSATLAVVESEVRRASDGGARHTGVLGIRARPEWSGPTEIKVQGLTVRVVACASSLACRAALRTRDDASWLVLITDRSDADLGLGILSHLRKGRLQLPDSWAPVREAFGAPRIEERLAGRPDEAAIAAGLAAVRGTEPWPQARTDLLTLDHVCGAVAQRTLGLEPAGSSLSLDDVMRWSATTESPGLLLNGLARSGGAELSALVHSWIAAHAGAVGPAWGAMAQSGRVQEILPLGLAVRAVLESPAGSGTRVHLRLKFLGGQAVSDHTLGQLVTSAEATLLDLHRRRDTATDAIVGRLLSRGDEIVADLEADDFAAASVLLPSALDRRLDALGSAVHTACARAQSALEADADASAVARAHLDEVEAALVAVNEHVRPRERDARQAQLATDAVRLVRWLSHPRVAVHAIDDATRLYRDDESWVDRAYADVWRGADGPALFAKGLGTVASAVRTRRRASDRRFAQALASSSGDGFSADVLPIERVLSTVVLPLAKTVPVLFIIADGMSAAVASEIVDDLTRGVHPWRECLREGLSTRTAVLAALPSLTEVSRCSLLTGALTSGKQDAERNGFQAALEHAGLTGNLVHKMGLEKTPSGHALGHDVAARLDNTAGTRIVACVLNTIDDALDRSDPGQDWTQEAVAHLGPLLERARRAGRTVVLTSDHGHVVERRQGHYLQVSATTSNRSRPGGSTPKLGEDEVRVSGPRVLTEAGTAILAVDEDLRYGSLKAGYHGGASPAEVVIPLHILTAGEVPTGWVEAVPQAPRWWTGPLPVASGSPAAPASATSGGDDLTLFETSSSPVTHGLAARVTGSAIYAAQRRQAAGIAVTDLQVQSLIEALESAPTRKLASERAAQILVVPTARLAGAIGQVQRLLNIEQYAVISIDQDRAVVLDESLLREQFEVHA